MNEMEGKGSQSKLLFWARNCDHLEHTELQGVEIIIAFKELNVFFFKDFAQLFP